MSFDDAEDPLTCMQPFLLSCEIPGLREVEEFLELTVYPQALFVIFNLVPCTDPLYSGALFLTASRPNIDFILGVGISSCLVDLIYYAITLFSS